MALDIYSGTLGRYYTGDWQNRLQVWATAQGLECSVNRKEAEGLDTSELTDADMKRLAERSPAFLKDPAGSGLLLERG